MATVAATASSLRQVLQCKELKWAIGGWTFFIAENAILSENRTYLIQALDGGSTSDNNGDEHNYHLLYGTLSTAATASIGYAHYHLTRKNATLVQYFKSTALSKPTIPVANLLLSWTCLSVGLVLASQALPKMQIPIRLTSSSSSSSSSQPSTTTTTGNDKPIGPPPQPQQSAGAAEGWKLSVQCPFDFSDKYKDKTSSNNNDSNNNDIMVTGVDRVSRHVGLWSLGLMSAAQAALIVPSTAVSTAAAAAAAVSSTATSSSSSALFAALWSLRLWWCGPLAVAWLGGMHTDSRFRRNMGGTLDPLLDSQTSNIPFLAMLTGKQGPTHMAFYDFWSELKPLNAVVAAAAATIWIMSKGRASASLSRSISSSSTSAAAASSMASSSNLASASTATPKIITATTGAATSSSSSSLSSRRKRPW